MITPTRLAVIVSAIALTAGAPPPAARSQIPVPSDSPGDTLAVLYSGDGGWGSLDNRVAHYLAAHGVPTVGVNSLSYFRARRSPESVAEDLAATLRDYGARWGRKKVVLIGYSFGADALPAIVPKLPADVRGEVATLVLMGTGAYGNLRFHPTSWLNIPTRDSFPVRPAIGALTDLRVTCIYGAKEHADICASLPDGQVAKVRVPGGHHFNGDYASLGDVVLKAIR